MPNSYQIIDGVKAIPLSALPAEAWSPTDPLDTPGETSARRLRATVPILARSLDMRGKAVATFPLRLERDGNDVADTPEGRAVLARLRALMYRSEVGLCMSAAAYWEIATNRAGRNPTPYWCATGTVNETRDSESGDPTFYRTGRRSGRTLGLMDPARVAAFYLPSDDVDAGPDQTVAPVRTTLAAAGLLRGLDQYGTAFFARGGVKITLLQVEAALPKLERDKLKDWWDRATRGVRDAFRSLVISNKVEPKVIGSDPKDTAAPELQAAAREDVAVGMGVPLSLLLSDALAGGTADAERLNFYELTVIPEVDLILPTANEIWLARLGYEVIADYDRLEVRQWAFAQRAEALQKLVGTEPILTVDEARARLGLPPRPQIAPPAEPTPPDAAPPTDVPGDAPDAMDAEWDAESNAWMAEEDTADGFGGATKARRYIRDSRGRFAQTPGAAERSNERTALIKTHKEQRSTLRQRHAEERAAAGRGGDADVRQRQQQERQALREAQGKDRLELSQRHAEQRQSDGTVAASAPKPAEPAPVPAATPEQAPKPRTRTAQQADKALRESSAVKATDLSKAEETALRTYQGAAYQDINAALRSGNKRDLRENRETIGQLDRVMQRARLTEDVETHRGMVVTKGSDAEKLLDSWKPGATFREDGYTSTTVDRGAAQNYARTSARDAQEVEVTIRAPAGTRALYFNAAIPTRPGSMVNYERERELLIDRGATYRVVSKTTKGRRTSVVLEVVPYDE